MRAMERIIKFVVDQKAQVLAEIEALAKQRNLTDDDLKKHFDYPMYSSDFEIEFDINNTHQFESYVWSIDGYESTLEKIKAESHLSNAELRAKLDQEIERRNQAAFENLRGLYPNAVFEDIFLNGEELANKFFRTGNPKDSGLATSERPPEPTATVLQFVRPNTSDES